MRKFAGIMTLILLCSVMVVSTSGCKKLFGKKTPSATTGVPGPEGTQYPAIGDLGAGIDVGETSAYPPSPRMPADTQVPELRTIYFAYDSSDLSAEAQASLDAAFQYLQSNPNLSVQVEGHCDERGSREYNYPLGQRRADVVRQYLVQRGIDGSRLNTISYGEDRPVAPGSSEEAWQQNRRVQFMSY